MVAVALKVVAFLGISCACASHPDTTMSVPDLMFRTLFAALKTGVFEIHECFDMDWLYKYTLFLTKESIDRFETLLVEKPTDKPRPDQERLALDPASAVVVEFECQLETHGNSCSGKRASTSSQNTLMEVMKKEATHNPSLVMKLLAKYATFRVLLYGRLGLTESEISATISSVKSERENDWIRLEQFLGALARVEGHGDLFAVLATHWDIYAVRSIFDALISRNPDTVTELIGSYAKSNEADRVEIPTDLFSWLNPECQYYLATTFTDLKRYYPAKVPWYDLYIRSRFSRLPSENVRATCLKANPGYLVYEREPLQKADDCASAAMPSDHLDAIPKDIWLKILLHLDLLSLVYIVPAVCTVWKCWHSSILDRSWNVQQEFARDSSHSAKLAQIIALECCPWNYFLSSRLTTLKYLLCREGPLIEDGSHAQPIVEKAWGHARHRTGGDRISVSSKLYCDLYVRCCRAASGPLEFYQPPGMPDEVYVASIRNIVENSQIVPAIPAQFLKEDCGRFVQMMKNDSDLIGVLLYGSLRFFNRLIVHLSSSKSHVPPEVAAILGKNSTMYRLLLGENEGTDDHFDAVSKNFVKDLDDYTLAYSVMHLCLHLGLDNRPEVLESLKKGISDCIAVMASGYRCTRPSASALLGDKIVTFLSINRKYYNEEELSIIERVLGQCEIWDKDAMQQIFNVCTPRFLYDSGFTIKLVGQL